MNTRLAVSKTRNFPLDAMLPSVGQYCRAIGMVLYHFTEWKQADCPCCGAPRALLIRPDSGAFKCRRCGIKGGNLVKLHMQITCIPYQQAIAELLSIRGEQA